MKLRMACILVLMFVLLFLAAFSVHGQSTNPQYTLNQYVSDLQKNPNDYVLREKIEADPNHPQRLITGGGSAGGHVSVLATLNPGLNDPQDPREFDTRVAETLHP